MRYIALLRGINVGGNNKVPMSELKECFESLTFTKVRTYINSGNVIFDTNETDSNSILKKIKTCLAKQFGGQLDVVLVDEKRYKKILDAAPSWWGKDPAWKHNLIFMLSPYNMDEVISAIGELKPGIEAIKSGDGYIFQSLQFDKFGKTTTGKIASNPVYKKMTIRNYNTSKKLLTFLETV